MFARFGVQTSRVQLERTRFEAEAAQNERRGGLILRRMSGG